MKTRETAVRIADHWAKILTQDHPNNECYYLTARFAIIPYLFKSIIPAFS